MKVLLVPNYSRADAVQAAATLEVWLAHEGVEVLWAHDKKREPNRVCDPAGACLVVSLGGDGTLLRAASIVGYREIPILGLSFGHLGFLTGAGSKNIVESVSRALAGEMHQSRRATLDVDVTFCCGGGLMRDTHHFALNELALTRGALGDMIEFDVSVSGNRIDRLRGDGFVVATATGSTGYALSSGGPIVTPEFNGMVCVPIAPHTVRSPARFSRPRQTSWSSSCQMSDPPRAACSWTGSSSPARRAARWPRARFAADPATSSCSTRTPAGSMTRCRASSTGRCARSSRSSRGRHVRPLPCAREAANHDRRAPRPERGPHP